jgi:hypothetical protein
MVVPVDIQRLPIGPCVGMVEIIGEVGSSLLEPIRPIVDGEVLVPFVRERFCEVDLREYELVKLVQISMSESLALGSVPRHEDGISHLPAELEGAAGMVHP